MRDEKAVNLLDMHIVDIYAPTHGTNCLANPLGQACGPIFTCDVISKKNITVNIYLITMQSHKASAFQGAAFAGLYGGRPAYTSKTPSTNEMDSPSRLAGH